MKRLLIVIISIGLLAVLIALVLPNLTRARAYSGPGVFGNLEYLQRMKNTWQLDNTNHAKEWPMADDIFADLAPDKPLEKILRPKYGEIYIINRTGEPPCVYFPPTARTDRAGQLLCIKSNRLVPLQCR